MESPVPRPGAALVSLAVMLTPNLKYIFSLYCITSSSILVPK